MPLSRATRGVDPYVVAWTTAAPDTAAPPHYAEAAPVYDVAGPRPSHASSAVVLNETAFTEPPGDTDGPAHTATLRKPRQHVGAAPVYDVASPPAASRVTYEIPFIEADDSYVPAWTARNPASTVAPTQYAPAAAPVYEVMTSYAPAARAVALYEAPPAATPAAYEVSWTPRSPSDRPPLSGDSDTDYYTVYDVVA